MRKMTLSEAVQLVETVFEASPDLEVIRNDMSGLVEITVIDIGVDQARADIGSYLAMTAEVDPDSITVTEDQIEEAPEVTATLVSIKTEGR